MPYYPLSQRSFRFRFRLEPTIPLILYPDRDSIYYQIINNDLYDFLVSNLSDFLIDTGDFFTDDPSVLEKFDFFINLFYFPES